MRRVCRSSLLVYRRSWKRVRRACGVKVRPRRVWTKCAVCYGSADTCATDSQHIFFALLFPPQLPLTPSRYFIAYCEPVLICPRARDTRPKTQRNRHFHERNEDLLNFWIATRYSIGKKQNHCAAISSTILHLNFMIISVFINWYPTIIAYFIRNFYNFLY